jgi:KipI family sensor histidine kinase inhibitor
VKPDHMHMSQPPARVLPCGDAALLVELDGDIDGMADRVLAVDAAVGGAQLPGIVGCVPGLTTVMVEFDPFIASADELADQLLRLASTTAVRARAGRRFELPVCFARELAPDLDAVAAASAMSADAVVGLVCGTDLRVALIGHLPGLPYLTGLPTSLDVPRRASVRLNVPRGSLGLAARMACVYPQSAPGGWHVVGRTPARLVDTETEPPVRLEPGDWARILAIDTSRFEELEHLEAEGRPSLRLLE